MTDCIEGRHVQWRLCAEDLARLGLETLCGMLAASPLTTLKGCVFFQKSVLRYIRIGLEGIDSSYRLTRSDACTLVLRPHIPFTPSAPSEDSISRFLGDLAAVLNGARVSRQ